MSVLSIVQEESLVTEVARLEPTSTRQLTPGQRLGGHTTESVTVVTSGILGVFLTRSGRSNVVVEVYGPGDQIVGGDPAEFANEEGRWETRALTETTVVVVSAQVFAQAVANDHRFARAVAAASHGQHRSMLAHRHLLQLPPTSRVAAVLLFLTRSLSSPDHPDAPLPLTQDVVAAISSLSRQTTNQVLRTLRRDGGLAVRRGQIAIVDKVLLSTLASGGSAEPEAQSA